jgi:uncharacterized protein YjbJ (UPF0337 family)
MILSLAVLAKVDFSNKRHTISFKPGSSRGQRTEDRRQKAEDRGQRTEDRRQRAEGRRQKAEGRRQRTEDRGQKAEGRNQDAGNNREPEEKKPVDGNKKTTCSFIDLIRNRLY